MSFSLTILGSSSALPTSSRFPTAQVLNVHERFFLIDCGEGTQIQLRKFKIPFNKIDNVFISHLHGDHYFGLFGLISSFSLLGRKNTLNIYGPPGLQKILDFNSGLYDEPLNYSIRFIPLKAKGVNLIYNDKHLNIFSLPLKHRIVTSGFIFKENMGLYKLRKEAIDEFQLTVNDIRKIKTGEDFIDADGYHIPNYKLTIPPDKPRSYAYCSDTMYSESIAKHINGVDLLYHEATFLEEMKERAWETGHSTAIQAARLAKKANAGKLMLGHFSARYKTYDAFLSEAKSEFEDVIIAEDGMTLNI
ncbi:MAG: ribonuclease Z [Bacteroidetes bacterium GWF2_38_335]|nr:MAG: ribonuclease Z [Bacteroidetes bacterium GWF2_38_335]OFY79040.1 MAG: ribonuclease Z [Bacteroidetes bacterium RIFOXYA12_FULL_38_20]HBS86121.1 ribonuclease Z [Bacteroidales bacterium]